jgi:hypothetical protein
MICLQGLTRGPPAANATCRAGLALGQLKTSSSYLREGRVDWERGWCRSNEGLATQKALSLGVSMLIGVSGWVVAMVFGLWAINVARARRRRSAHFAEDRDDDLNTTR